jgi:8-oxo-dGTP diphosphatase
MASRLLQAAGGVVYRDDDPSTGPQFLVVHRPRYRDWSLPKGKLDRGESFEEAALREIREETGLKCVRRDYLGAVSYATQRGRSKVVKYWLMKVKKGSFQPNDEVDIVEWVGIHGARALLTYNRDIRILDRAYASLNNSTSTRVYLVRHGNSGVRSKWKGPDKKRPLTERGHLQALSIADIMARHPITEAWSSPALRCVQTIEPLAAAIGAKIGTTQMLSEAVDIDTIYEYLNGLDPGAAVLGVHKDWVGPLLKDLDRRRIPIRGKRRWPKGSIWIIDLTDGKVTSAFYEGHG